jgi:hypothetical protein
LTDGSIPENCRSNEGAISEGKLQVVVALHCAWITVCSNEDAISEGKLQERATLGPGGSNESAISEGKLQGTRFGLHGSNEDAISEGKLQA